MNLTDDVIATEFPSMKKLVTPDGKKVVMTFKNGQSVVIGVEQPDGSYDSEVYQFSDVDDNLVFPDNPEFPEFLSQLKLDQFDGVANSNARDDYNNNIKHIENTVNGLVDYSIEQKGYFDKLKGSFGDIKNLIMKHVAIIVAKYMHDNVETKYYTKADVDGKLKYLQQQINNLNNAVEYKPDSSSLNSVFPPSYTGDKQVDINDEIQDANIENKIDSLKQNLEKEKD
ncbi:hypothetical protein NV391_02575 [Companilactobacillus crustorum]|uniref:hypothetical protein n=1 Tax=Companilactobacillus crustorum TaxID=392416 RepID=UPI000EF0882A|nr:hypothetical protein [Companilactobacillus crustorum]WDT66110.1 hypothetical protein NV391_02575 [Companilactobacillus crustorum]HCD07648.1 hypothetical protein [Lactobacillus sp.]